MTTPRDELIERIAEAMANRKACSWRGQCKSDPEGCSCLKDARAAIAVVDEQAWRKIDEQAKSGEEYLLHWQNNNGWTQSGLYDGLEHGWCDQDGESFARGPTHYAPLPAPPATEGKETT